jgi:hypothetical protein
MPMGGMPLGGMMPGDGAAGSSGSPSRPKKVVVPPTPHTESVTGKVSADHIAMSAAAPRDAKPPNDDQPPLVRRNTPPRPRSEES